MNAAALLSIMTVDAAGKASGADAPGQASAGPGADFLQLLAALQFNGTPPQQAGAQPAGADAPLPDSAIALQFVAADGAPEPIAALNAGPPAEAAPIAVPEVLGGPAALEAPVQAVLAEAEPADIPAPQDNVIAVAAKPEIKLEEQDSVASDQIKASDQQTSVTESAADAPPPSAPQQAALIEPVVAQVDAATLPIAEEPLVLALQAAPEAPRQSSPTARDRAGERAIAPLAQSGGEDALAAEQAEGPRPAHNIAPQARNAANAQPTAGADAPSPGASTAPAAAMTAAETIAGQAGFAERPQAVTPTRAAALSQLPPAAASVAQQIVRRFDGGSTQFEIRLDPPELGRVDVRIEVSRDKKVTATIAADSPQTLQEFVRSARELQRALSEAGIDLADNGLTFSDRRSAGAQDEPDASSLRGRATNDEPVSEAAPARPFGVERWGRAGVDVWV